MYYSVVKNGKEVDGYTCKNDAMKLFKRIKKEGNYYHIICIKYRR